MRNLSYSELVKLKLKWRPATYHYEPLTDWFVSENGILINKITRQIKYGHDNVPGRDRHQRVSIRHKLYYVSRIVAEAFVENPDPKRNIVVRHYDDNPLNNHYSNLIWGTYQENTYDGIRNGKIKYDENRNVVKGDTHPMRILSEAEVENISAMLIQRVPINDIAKQFNVAPAVIYHIYNGNSWRCVTEKYLPFPQTIGAEKRPGLPEDIKKQITEWLNDDTSVYPSEIISKLNLQDNPTVRGFIGYTKRKILKNKRSIGFNE